LNLAYVKSILIVDDSPLIRRSLRTLFEQQPDWAVCGEAENGCEGIDKAQTLHPDLIVLDLAMPRLNGIDASRMLKRLMPATPIVMFTTFTNPFVKKRHWGLASKRLSTNLKVLRLSLQVFSNC
jgi:DNA-binding NarL/FixJ family response regulator